MSGVIDDVGRLFAEYHTANPEVWELFEKLSFERMRKGYTRFGAMAILNRIRWDHSPKRYYEGVAVVNTWAPFYARLFHARYPQHKGFFETKASVADDCETYILHLAAIMKEKKR